jgi:uncharacterized membrane protein
LTARWHQLKDSMRSGFWAIPTACVLTALALALGLVELDKALGSTVGFTFGAGPSGAREVLSAITSAMITFTGLVFSITIVVLQLTSSQFSPRVLRTFLRDRRTQLSLGIFVATFVYAIMVLRTVDSGEDSVFVPAVATSVALALLLLSVGVFVQYIHHIATSIQVSAIIGTTGDETRSTLDRRFPPGRSDPPDSGLALKPAGRPTAVVQAQRSGVVTYVDEARLVQLACAADVVLRARVRLGDFLPEGAPLLEVFGDASALDTAAVSGAVRQDRDRTLQQDVAFGFRQLVDIAERALSSGVNDPTTAVQAVDELHDLLRRLATRPLRSGVHLDDDGALRLVVPPERLEDYLSLALDEIEHYGADDRQVQSRIDALLDDVAAAALPEHRPDVEERCARRRTARAR